MADPTPPDPWLHPRDVMSTAQVRRLCGGVERHTLLRWRRDRGFPGPWAVIRHGRGKRAQTLELWDRRKVRAWLKANPPVQ